jgi:hypothetical protein
MVPIESLPVGHTPSCQLVDGDVKVGEPGFRCRHLLFGFGELIEPGLQLGQMALKLDLLDLSEPIDIHPPVGRQRREMDRTHANHLSIAWRHDAD